MMTTTRSRRRWRVDTTFTSVTNLHNDRGYQCVMHNKHTNQMKSTIKRSDLEKWAKKNYMIDDLHIQRAVTVYLLFAFHRSVIRQ